MAIYIYAFLEKLLFNRYVVFKLTRFIFYYNKKLRRINVLKLVPDWVL